MSIPLVGLAPVLRRVAALPACDNWTAALLRTVARGNVDGKGGCALMVRARADALALELTRAAMRSGVTFGDLAVMSALEASHAALAGNEGRAAQALRHAAQHLAAATLVNE